MILDRRSSQWLSTLRFRSALTSFGSLLDTLRIPVFIGFKETCLSPLWKLKGKKWVHDWVGSVRKSVMFTLCTMCIEKNRERVLKQSTDETNDVLRNGFVRQNENFEMSTRKIFAVEARITTAT